MHTYTDEIGDLDIAVRADGYDVGDAGRRAMSAGRIIRRSWANVTLAEYAALRVLREPNPEQILNAVWDDIHNNNPFAGPDDEPTRLTREGSDWLVELRREYFLAGDELDVQRIARDVVAELGTLVVMAAERRVRGAGR